MQHSADQNRFAEKKLLTSHARPIQNGQRHDENDASPTFATGGWLRAQVIGNQDRLGEGLEPFSKSPLAVIFGGAWGGSSQFI